MEEKKTQNQEPKKHLTSAERQAIYEQHARDTKLSVRGSKKRKRVLFVSLCTLAFLLIAGGITALIVLDKTVWGPARTYEGAIALMDSEDYLGAYRVFTDLGDYSDSADKAQDCILLNAKKLTGRDDAVISGREEMPWFSLSEDGTLSFDKDVYDGDGNIVIPDIFDGAAVTAIGDSCFFYASFMQSVTIPATVQTIGERAFYSCTALTELVLPDSVTTIGEKAFGECTAIKTVTLSKNLAAAGEKAFISCTSIETIELPEGFREIKSRLFNGCTSLRELTLPSSITYIGNYAFTGCTSLEKVTYNGTRESLEQLCTGEGKEIILDCKELITK